MHDYLFKYMYILDPIIDCHAMLTILLSTGHRALEECVGLELFHFPVVLLHWRIKDTCGKYSS